MRWFVGLAVIGLAAALLGWQGNIPQLIRPGLWLVAPLGAIIALGTVGALLFGWSGGRATYLNVPFPEKDAAKSRGARWDPKRRSWYVPPAVDTTPFARWLPMESSPAAECAPALPLPSPIATLEEDEEAERSPVIWSGHATLFSPIYVAESFTSCWKCHRRTPVVAIAGSGAEMTGDHVAELVVANNVDETLPGDLAAEVGRRYPRYQLAYSKTGGGRYYMNHCAACNAKLGDSFLHAPGAAFVPTDPRTAFRIILRQLPVTGPFEVCGAFTIRSPNLIHECAQRLPT
jgi:hypothetical protein